MRLIAKCCKPYRIDQGLTESSMGSSLVLVVELDFDWMLIANRFFTVRFYAFQEIGILN